MCGVFTNSGGGSASKLMEDAIDDSDVSSLVQVMLGIDPTSLKVAFCSNNGFPVFLSAMTQWTKSLNIQESGCLLLAEIYFHLHYPIDAMETVEGPWAPQNCVSFAALSFGFGPDAILHANGKQTR